MVCSSADVSSAWWEVCDDLEGPNFPIPAGFQVHATICTCLLAYLCMIPGIEPPNAAYVNWFMDIYTTAEMAVIKLAMRTSSS